MSTFDGYVKEFPNLAIDYFRPRHPSLPPVQVYLLSHVHTDHLQGLESRDFGGAFIYCSQATKTLLLRLQERNHRVSLARGETCEPVYKYGHLRVKRGARKQDLLRVLSYQCPTKIALGSETVQVTMFDANHCPGSSMFLVETRGRRILYTGDVRAEPLFLTNLLAEPVMLPYVSGHCVLDTLYLDTSARAGGPEYPSKSRGCLDLVRAISRYPPTTKFYLDAWCLGYEDLWIAIGRTFGVKIHVDTYRYALYASLATTDVSCPYSKLLAGSEDGLLTTHVSPATITRFHSCESIDPCAHRPHEHHEVYIKTVNAINVVSRRPRTDDATAEERGSAHCTAEDDRHETHLSLTRFDHDDKGPPLYGPESQDDGMTEQDTMDCGDGRVLPRTLVIPFARHSSWPELVALVRALGPREVHACTGDVGWRFAAYCRQDSPAAVDDTNEDNDDDDDGAKIEEYKDLARAGLWNESARIKRQRLMEDIVL